jgi:hypothetical protein
MDYVPVGVEKEVPVTVGGVQRTVVPDFICGSARLGHLLCIDVKSKTIDSDQVARYEAIEGRQMVLQGIAPAGMSPTGATSDSSFAASDADSVALSRRIADVGSSLPLVSCSDNAFRLVLNGFRSNELHHLFKTGLSVTARDWPRSHVEFGIDSTDAEIVARVVSAAAALMISKRRFHDEQVAAKAVRHWEYCGTQERNQFTNQVGLLMQRASREELRPFLNRDKSASAWVILGNIIENPQRASRFHSEAAKFVHRVQNNHPFKPMQPRLFE